MCHKVDNYFVRLVPLNMFKTSRTVLTDRLKAFCGFFVICVSCVCACVRLPRSLVCDVFCDFVTFLYNVLGQVRYLIVSISDLCHLPL